MMRQGCQKIQKKVVTAWNAKVKVGDTIEYCSYPEAYPMRFTTATKAFLNSANTAVVWLNGKRGCVAVDACRPIAAEVKS